LTHLSAAHSMPYRSTWMTYSLIARALRHWSPAGQRYRRTQGAGGDGARPEAVRFVHTLKAPENGFLCQNSRFERRKPVPWGRSRHGWRDALREMASRGIGCGLVLGSKLRYRRLQAALI
jgi:hypothetical protein